MNCPDKCEVYIRKDVLTELAENSEKVTAYPWKATSIHTHKQDEEAPEWIKLLELVEEAARDKRTLFRPADSLGWDVWSNN